MHTDILHIYRFNPRLICESASLARLIITLAANTRTHAHTHTHWVKWEDLTNTLTSPWWQWMGIWESELLHHPQCLWAAGRLASGLAIQTFRPTRHDKSQTTAV